MLAPQTETVWNWPDAKPGRRATVTVFVFADDRFCTRRSSAAPDPVAGWCDTGIHGPHSDGQHLTYRPTGHHPGAPDPGPAAADAVLGRFERQLVEQRRYNMLYRWFVGVSLDDAVWDGATFTRKRQRRRLSEQHF
ncbi:MAG: transposase [Salinisphaera sp.]|uniref:transposase n=1 Tax=Salinisphaera sp. TaxID=1914330 RepID=UPI003C7A5BE9